MEAEKEIQEYLSSYVNPTMSQMLVDIIKERPRNILHYCKMWCQKKIEFHKTITHIDSDEEEEDFIDERVFRVKLQRLKNQNRRNGVCGVIHNNLNKDYEIEAEANLNKKKGLVRNKILFRLKSTFLFNDINENDLNLLINAMEELHVDENEIVLKEGENGEEVYILDEGELECYRFDKEMERNVHLKLIKEGEIFGELSILYNIPRTATLIAIKKSVLFKLDRKTFSSVIHRKNIQKRKIYAEVIDSVDLFKELNINERIKLEDIMQEMNIETNQYVIREGRIGNKLYIVLKGQLVALKKNENGNENVVFEYKEGSYFGELSLISNKARAASVMALTNTKLLYIEREAFSRVIGPMEGILQRNEEIYSKYIKFAHELEE